MLFASPVPTHTTFGSVGATAIAPTDPVRTESNTGAQLTPALTVFHTPPVAAATYITVPMRARGAFGSTTTTMSETRPDMTAGPIERNASDRTSTESGGSAASLRTAVSGVARPGWLTVGRPCAPATEAKVARRLTARSV